MPRNRLMSDHDLLRRKQQLLHGTLRRPVKAKTAALDLTDRPLFWITIGLVGLVWVYFVIGFP